MKNKIDKSRTLSKIDDESTATVATVSVQGQHKKDRIKKEMVTPGNGGGCGTAAVADDYSSTTLEYQYMPR